MTKHVAPFTGAWIEMFMSYSRRSAVRSLPSRERGLKFSSLDPSPESLSSLPSRERGLKFADEGLVGRSFDVAPFTGAWIEITLRELACGRALSRSLHGSVD